MTLLICGAGQYGLAVKDTAEQIGDFSEIIFSDDKSKIAVGKLEEIDKIRYDAAFIAIGNPEIRRDLFKKTKKIITLIHPKAVVMPSAEIGEGSIIEAGAVVSSNSKIGRGTIVMSGAVVGHDAAVGDFCQLKYNSSVPERSVVPNGTKLECNTVFRDADEIRKQNEIFIENEKRKNGKEPSFF